MNGEGFETTMTKNKRVEKGDTLAVFDMKLIEERGFKTVIPVIVLEHDSVASLELFPSKSAKANETYALKIRLNE